MRHLFTVDVEEYFQVAALEPFVPRARWPELPSRLAGPVDALLELLARHDAHGTFFTLGIVAERCPKLIHRIAAAGHEVASHGWSHRRVDQLSPQEFRLELIRSRNAISEITGRPVIGFRAPNFSIGTSEQWAYDVLIEENFVYDSSRFPARQWGSSTRIKSGIERVPRGGGEILEIAVMPASTAGLKLPAGGGAWFRLLPYLLTQRALRQAAQREEPGVFYIHPWELDAEQPKLAVDLFTRVRHYGGLKRVKPLLERLLCDFRFTSVQEWLTRATPLSVAAAG